MNKYRVFTLCVVILIMWRVYRVSGANTDEYLGSSYIVSSLAPNQYLKEQETFNLVQYNVQLSPTIYIHEGIEERSEQIPRRVATINSGDIDVITLCEAFDDNTRRTLWRLFSTLGWAYHSKVVDSLGHLTNGGVTIISKWPILSTDQIVYTNYTGTDGIVAKGAIYVKIQKNHTLINVFATHLQAWSKKIDKQVRIAQLKELYSFYLSKQIPNREPVIFAGDFNTDMINSYKEVITLFSILKATSPFRIGSQKYTSDPETNSLVGQDGAAQLYGCQADYYCSICYSSGTTNLGWCASDLNANRCLSSIQLLPRCKCCPKEYLDYVLYSTVHRAPIRQPTVEIIKLKAVDSFIFTNWHIGDIGEPRFLTDDLSDHYPVLAKFVF